MHYAPASTIILRLINSSARPNASASIRLAGASYSLASDAAICRNVRLPSSRSQMVAPRFVQGEDDAINVANARHDGHDQQLASDVTRNNIFRSDVGCIQIDQRACQENISA